jgi:prepilin-type N-terminal cleavage/methylation domain-containing protein
MATNSRSSRAGFTLIELLVVIGIIGIMAGAIGLSMRDGNPSAGLRAGQSSLVGLLSAARGQAALTQSDAMIVVDVTDAANDDCLRSLMVVVRASAGIDKWRPVGGQITLPQGIYVVPPTGVTPNAGTVTLNSGFTSKRRSQGFQPSGTLIEETYNATTYPYQPSGAFANKRFIRFQIFSSLGTTAGEGTILLTSGQRTSAANITMDNPSFLRGVYVSRYGVPTLINEATTFDQVTVTP